MLAKEIYNKIFGNENDGVTIGNMETLEGQGFEFVWYELRQELQVFKNGTYYKNVQPYYNDDVPDAKDFAEEILNIFE